MTTHTFKFVYSHILVNLENVVKTPAVTPNQAISNLIFLLWLKLHLELEKA